MGNLTRTKKALIFFVVVAIFVAILFCNYLYESNYDAYYDSAIAQAAKNGDLMLQVNIESKRLEYHHLGEDISQEFTCNGKIIHDGDHIKASDVLFFTVTITEHDSTPDIGQQKVSMILPPYKNTETITIQIDENGRSKYQNSYAIYEVTFAIQPTLENIKIYYWQVVFSGLKGETRNMYDLFQLGPAVYIPVILISLLITLIAYSFFPILYSKTRKKIITKKQYLLTCFGVNFIVMILFIVVNGEASNGAPYALWTSVFFKSGIRILQKRGILDGYQTLHSEESAPSNTDGQIEPHTTHNTDTPPEPPINTNSREINLINCDTYKQSPQKKAKYCSQCGFQIDSITKQCTGCGKQYFKGFSKKHINACIAFLTIALVMSCTLLMYKNKNLQKENVGLSNKNSSLEATLKEKQSTIYSLSKEVGDLELDVWHLEMEIDSYQSQIDFFDKYVVFVEDDGTNLYHKYECSRFVGNRYWAFNIEAAIYKGYEPCPMCYSK